jgi:hypothetical protein
VLAASAVQRFWPARLAAHLEVTEEIVPRGSVDFSKPTLDSVRTELACMWSLGMPHRSSISIRLEGEKKEEEKMPSNS